MKKHDHKAKEEDAKNQALKGKLELGGEEFSGEVADERTCKHLCQVAPCDKEIVAPFCLIEIADVIDKPPEEEKDHNAAPKFSGDEENRLNPIPIDSDPVGILLTQFA